LTRFVKIQPGHSLPIAKTKLRETNEEFATYTSGKFSRNQIVVILGNRKKAQ